MMPMKKLPAVETESSPLLRAQAELNSFVAGIRKPPAVQLAEANLRSARKARARAHDHATVVAAKYRVAGEGNLRGIHESEELVAMADQAVNTARRHLEAAREKWKPALLAEISPHRSAAEKLLEAGLADVRAALSLLDQLGRLAASHGVDAGSFPRRARSGAVEVLYQ